MPKLDRSFSLPLTIFGLLFDAFRFIRLSLQPRKEWVAHDNKGRPHSGLGPGIPEPSEGIPVLEILGHRVPCGQPVVGNAVLDGSHHEYRLEK
jgi:hypothetical protein